uniref:Uncharacterized protein n=1 Tax=Oryza nivara TaxID=4536 RepID=A0A0E0FXR3_ORYNI
MWYMAILSFCSVSSYLATLNSSGRHCDTRKKSGLSTLSSLSTTKSLSGDNCSLVISSAKARSRSLYDHTSACCLPALLWISFTIASISLCAMCHCDAAAMWCWDQFLQSRHCWSQRQMSMTPRHCIVQS